MNLLKTLLHGFMTMLLGALLATGLVVLLSTLLGDPKLAIILVGVFTVICFISLLGYEFMKK